MNASNKLNPVISQCLRVLQLFTIRGTAIIMSLKSFLESSVMLVHVDLERCSAERSVFVMNANSPIRARTKKKHVEGKRLEYQWKVRPPTIEDILL